MPDTHSDPDSNNPPDPTNSNEGPDPVVQLLESFGLDEPLAPEEYAPPVDQKLLKAYAGREAGLTIEDKEMVEDLSAQFKSWRNALVDTLRERNQTRQNQTGR